MKTLNEALNNKQKRKRELVVNYPGSIKKMFSKIDTITKDSKGERIEPLYDLLSNANLPKGTRFRRNLNLTSGVIDGLTFSILLPSGEMFSAVAIKKPGDKNDAIKGLMAAAGRALAVYRENKVSPTGKLFMKKEDIYATTPGSDAIRGIISEHIISDMKRQGQIRQMFRSCL